MNSEEMIHVEVVYALPDVQRVIKVAAKPDSSVEQIIRQSGILVMYPEIDLAKNKIGIYSRNVKLDATVREGDRIEVYRPLIADPREIRRQRAEKAKLTEKKA
ncbi:RnfH family protein [Thaumasiovibrio sp. DFM-14]|uniref:RnfH family protein n=1 Tax=Thaumasiovibrio sp. DFM-14 TaxID=3384792 RepID=UPI00399EF4C7